jgi:peptidylprolyl isomerase
MSSNSKTVFVSGSQRLAGLALMSVMACGSAFAQTPPPAVAPKPAAVPAKPAAAAPAAPAAPAKPVAAAPAKSEGDVVARIGGEDVTVDEVRMFVAALGVREQVALARDPALLSQTLRLMLANRLVLKEAVAKKWADKPEVAVQLARIRESAVTESYLQSVSVPAASFPDDAAIKEAYEANKTAFLVPRQFQISQIFVALANDADKATEDAARKKLTEVQAKLKQPNADFAALANETSEQDNAPRGGDIGWVPEDQIRPEIKTQLMGLAKGAVGEPVKLDDGWHIVKLVDTKPSVMRTLEEVREALAQRLRAQQAEVLRRTYLAKLLEQTPPAINELALGKIFAPAPGAQQ